MFWYWNVFFSIFLPYSVIIQFKFTNIIKIGKLIFWHIFLQSDWCSEHQVISHKTNLLKITQHSCMFYRALTHQHAISSVYILLQKCCHVNLRAFDVQNISRNAQKWLNLFVLHFLCRSFLPPNDCKWKWLLFR